MQNEAETKVFEALQDAAEPEPELSRRHALQGLGALVVTSAVFGAAACDPDPQRGTGAELDAGASAAGTPGQRTSSAQPTPSAGAGGSSQRAASAGIDARPSNAQRAANGGMSGAGSGGATSQAGVSGTTAAGTGDSAGGGGTAGLPSDAAGANAQAGAGGSGQVDFDALDCVLTPELTEGPFFVDEKLNRSDLISGEEANVSSGLPLELTLGLFRVDSNMCLPMAGVQVDIWHADVDGIYSDVASGFLQSMATTGKKFLRAYQVTSEQGVVSFKTIYPGWYAGRAIHIHFKVRVPADAGGAAYEFTSQMFFDEKINDEVMALPAYSERGKRTILNTTDQVFNGTGPGGFEDTMGPPAGTTAPGEEVIVSLESLNNGAAYSATLKVGVRMS